ncbi:uncharacterized protein TNCV_3535241 [Trichonephila clavipes]|nr:uncharacterized protein TNCV_3535241 [Trichonephila clavipes]
MQCQERKIMNATEWITDSASITAAGAVEIMQLDDEIASILTPDCVGIYYVRWSLMKIHWAAAIARFTMMFVSNPFSVMCVIIYGFCAHCSQQKTNTCRCLVILSLKS